MKKTLIVNLNGRVFTIDEDAYMLLENYLNNLRLYFRKEEGAAEIIADFEGRIEELFSEKMRLGYHVITFEHVEEVISRVGRPADFASREDNEEEKKMSASEPVSGKKRLYRNMDNKLLGGVCSGIAAYFNSSTVAIRILLIIAAFVIPSIRFSFNHHFTINYMSNLGFWLFLAYLIAWIVIPAAQTAEQRLHMHGKPITVENIGKTVSAQSIPVAPKEQRGCLDGLVEVFVVFLKIFLVGLGCLIGLPLLFVFVILIIVFFALIFGVGGGILGASSGMFGFIPSFLAVEHPILLTVTGIFVFGIPVVALIYVVISHLAKWKPLNQVVKWMSFIVWVIALVLFFALGAKFNNDNYYNIKLKHPFSVAFHKTQSPFTVTFPLDKPFDQLEIDQYLKATVYVEQTDEDASIEIKGGDRFFDQYAYQEKDNVLRLYLDEKAENEKDIRITIRTNDLKSIKADFVGNIHIKGAFKGDDLKVIMRGAGNFYADDLSVNKLTVLSEGVGSAYISGEANKARLETGGVGKIDAIKLLSDSVYAEVTNVGYILCNPVEYLEGRVNGVGSITYKNEPTNKKVSVLGIGKVKKQ